MIKFQLTGSEIRSSMRTILTSFQKFSLRLLIDFIRPSRILEEFFVHFKHLFNQLKQRKTDLLSSFAVSSQLSIQLHYE